MSEDTYNTISDKSKGLFKDRGSKFLAFAYPVDNEIEVKKHIVTLKKKYHDARHHCYAYRIGTAEPFRFRLNDDGEPSGTAGKPIYGQILSKQLTNVLIVVVRYFGGTLLGTSGLIQAYRAAADDALNNAEIEQKVMHVKLRLHFTYNKMNAVMKIIKDESIEVTRQDFQEECELEVYVRRKLKDLIEKRFSLVEGLKITMI
jgi:uncharacterized YigZ family protein